MDGRGIQGQGVAGLALQDTVKAAEEMRDDVPEGLLDDRQPPAGLVLRRRAAAPDLVGLPGRSDLPLQRLMDLLDLFRRGVQTITLIQQFGDVVVLLQQGPAHHLGGVGRQHQLDVEVGDRGMQILAVPGRLHALEELLQGSTQRSRLGIPDPGPTASHPVMLLGDIGEVEELRKGAHHRYDQLVG